MDANETPAASADVAKEVLMEKLLCAALENLCRVELQRQIATPEGKAQLQLKTQTFLRDLLGALLNQGDTNAKEHAASE